MVPDLTADSFGSFVAVALKWVDLRPQLDPLTGAVSHDERTSGCSPADAAALEWALRLGESWQLPVVAVTAGPPGADAVLREAATQGVARLVRVAVGPDAPSDAVARALAPVFPVAAVVCCGDYSLDRGSGSVPAFLAHELAAAQALGLVGIAAEGAGSLVAERRLDGGRRERLRVTAPAVVSVEPAGVRLRRAPLAGIVAAQRAQVEVRTADAGPRHTTAVRVIRTTAYRPRPRVLPPPPADRGPRERLLALTGALVERTPPRVVKAGAEDAADELLQYLKSRGYLE
jgi:electron transfer flavoprotein beta subunit